MTESSDRCCRQFSLTLDAVSLTFEPYLKMQKKTDFQSDTRTSNLFQKLPSLTLEVGQSFSLTLEPDSNENIIQKEVESPDRNTLEGMQLATAEMFSLSAGVVESSK